MRNTLNFISRLRKKIKINITQIVGTLCREIDTVKVKGSDQAMRIFTVSIQSENLEPTDDPFLNLPINEKKQIRSELKRKLFDRLYTGKRTTW